MKRSSSNCSTSLSGEIALQHDFLVKSSDGDSTYVVQFILDAEKISVFCTCSAGAFGRICKHKLSLLNGDKSLLVDSTGTETFSEVQDWIKRSAWPELLSLFNDGEISVKVAQAEFAKAKKKIEAAMRNGL